MAIIVCPTCSQDDFENAYYVVAQANYIATGEIDEIVLPAGSATWGNSSRPNSGIIYLSTPVIVRGQGDSTVITMDDTGATYANGVIAMWAQCTFKDVKFIGASAGHPVTVFNIAAYLGPTGVLFTGGFKISNITYEGFADGYFAFIGSGVLSGLISSCRLSADIAYAELIFMRGPTDAWQLDNTIGGENNIFIEDCTFPDLGYVNDANANARMVVRYCTITGISKVDGHGLASNSPARSFRNMEVYGNTWTATGAGNWSNIEIRGGTVMVWGNSCIVGWIFLHDYAYDNSEHGWPNFGYGGTATAGNPTIITTNQPHGYSTGWPVWVQAPLGVIYGMYTITVTGPTTFTIDEDTTGSGNETIDYATTYKTPYDYPIQDQVGQGKDGGPMEPAYLWGNTQNGSAWARSLGTVSTKALEFYQAQTENPTATFTDRDVIQANRDFYADAGFDTSTGVSIGTTAEMNLATPTDGHGFWVTDQGSWRRGYPNTSGLLYVGNGSAWELYYTPYTYPHPLRNDEVGPIAVTTFNATTLTVG